MLDFTPAEWQELFERIDFTDKELIVIELKRRGWRNIDIAEAMAERIGYEVSERTIVRWWGKIKSKTTSEIEVDKLNKSICNKILKII